MKPTQPNRNMQSHNGHNLKRTKEAQIHECDICNKKYTRFFTLKKHLVKAHGRMMVPRNYSEVLKTKEPRIYKCQVCNHFFTRIGAVKRHVDKFHGQSPIPTNKSKIKPDEKFIKAGKVKRKQYNIRISNDLTAIVRKPSSKTHKCPVCSKEFRSLYNRVCHEETHTGNPTLLGHKCAVCDKKFFRMKDLKVHEKNHVKQSSKTTGKKVEKKHNKGTDRVVLNGDVRKLEKFTPKKKLYECLVCSKSLNRSADLRRHQSKMYKCVVCSKSFTCPNDFRWHRRIHPQQIHKCLVCSKSFTRPDGLQRHEKIHEKKTQNKKIKKPDSSSDRPKQSAENINTETIRQSKRHQKTHNNRTNRVVLNGDVRKSEKFTQKKKMHKCLVCSKSFNRADNLRRHQSKMYKCVVCSKSFTCPNDFNWHRRIHPQQIHKCLVCSKVFPRPDYLRRHEKIHQEKSCKSLECSKSFHDISYLRRHEKIHQPALHECLVCSKSFTRPDSLQLYEKIHEEKTQNKNIKKPDSLPDRPKKSAEKKNTETIRQSKRHQKTHNKRTNRVVLNGDVRKSEKFTPKKKMHKCLVCSKSFPRPNSLRLHEKMHERKTQNKENKKPDIHNGISSPDQENLSKKFDVFACNQCPAKLSSFYSLLQHHKLCHKMDKIFLSSETYYCDVCKKEFKEKSNFDEHWLMHKAEIPESTVDVDLSKPGYVCHVCGIGFWLGENLGHHMKSHGLQMKTNTPAEGKSKGSKVVTKAVKVKNVGKSELAMKSKEVKKLPMGKEAENIPIERKGARQKCGICGKKLGSLGMKYHMMRHRGETAFACSVCDFKCIVPTHMKYHMMAKHG